MVAHAARGAKPKPQLAPRTSRWAVGVALAALSILLLTFIAHAVLLSGFQHHRSQSLAYDELRTTLAKAETPVGQLDVDTNLVKAGTPVFLLQSSAIGLNEVVFEGTTSSILRSGAGHRRDSVMPGQQGTSVILGRQSTYGGPFANLNRLKVGDEITVTTGQGTHTYRVFDRRRAGDPLPDDLPAGSGRLQLQTSDGVALFPKGVLYIDAELVTKTVETPSKVLAYYALPNSERAMGDEPERWYAAFFYAFLFGLAALGVAWLWRHWGRWHAWLVGVPVLVCLGIVVSDAALSALPNVL